MKKVTRRHVQTWLSPIRACFNQMRQGEVDAIRGYAVTRLRADDDYARIDFCIAGFRGLLNRLFPQLGFLRRCEDAMVGLPRTAVLDAVLTEQIAIEFDQIRDAA